MSEVATSINLCGEYRIKILEEDTILSDSGWCKNTILSGGLVKLATLPFSDIINFLDLGISSSLSGIQAFPLSGVIAPSKNVVFSNIARDNFQIIYDSVYPNIRTYYASFASKLADTTTETITEFAIKPIEGNTNSAFARSVLSTPAVVKFNQSVNFEYRLSVDWSSFAARNFTPFRTPIFTIGYPATSYNTFYRPVTSVVYNIPEDRLFNPLNELVVFKNTGPLPSFGEEYPSPIEYGMSTEATSIFTPVTLSAYLDPVKKNFSMITQYSNISAPDESGIVTGIDTVVLQSPETKIRFLATKFKYPLTFYNYSRFTDITGLTGYDLSYDIFRKNIIGLNYRYTWGEALYSTLDFYYTNSAILPNVINNNTEIPCNIYKTIQCGTTKTVRILGSPITYTTRVIVGQSTGNITLDYNCNNTAVRFLAIYYPNDNTSLSAVRLADSGYRGIGDVFNQKLIDIGYPGLEGPATGSISFTKSSSSYTFIDIIAYSPLNYIGVDTYVEFNLTCPS